MNHTNPCKVLRQISRRLKLQERLPTFVLMGASKSLWSRAPVSFSDFRQMIVNGRAVKIGIGAIAVVLIVTGFFHSKFLKDNQTWKTLGSTAKDGEFVAYGNRSPECINPKISHLCSDYRVDDPTRGFSNHYFSITCDDSCGNIYTFSTKVSFSKTEEWRLGDWNNNSSIENFIVEKRVPKSSATVEEEEQIEQEASKIREAEGDLEKRASKLWREMLPRFQMPVPAGVAKFRFDPLLPSDMAREDFSQVNQATGHLLQLTKIYKQIALEIKRLEEQGAGRTPELNQQRDFVFQVFNVLKHNQYWLDSNDDHSLTYIEDIIGLQQDLLSPLKARVLPIPTRQFLLSLSEGPELRTIVSEKNQLSDRLWKNMRHAQELSESLDQSSKDATKKERCLSSDAKTYEVYPHRSPLRTHLESAASFIQSQLPSLEREAQLFEQKFLESLDDDSKQKRIEFHRQFPAHVSSVVPLGQGLPDWTDMNIWTKKAFEAVNEADPKGREKAFEFLGLSCDSINIRQSLRKAHSNENQKQTYVQPPQNPSDDLSNEDALILRYRSRLRGSEFVLEFWKNSSSKIRGIILLAESTPKSLDLKDLCLSLGGFCRDPREQVHSKPSPSISLPLHFGKPFPPVLEVPVKNISRKELLEHLSKAKSREHP